MELPEEDELFVSSQLQSFREQVQEHVNDHGVEGIGAYAVFSSASSCKIPKQHPEMTVTYIVFLMNKASSSHSICLGTIWRNFKRNRTPQVISLLL